MFKPSKPNTFDGNDLGYALSWTTELEQYFDAADMTSEEVKIKFAGAQLRGMASVWWKNLKQRLSVSTWEQFKEHFNVIYNPVPVKDTARAKIMKIQQTGSVQNYVNDFNKWINYLSDWGEGDKIFFFRKGLKPYLCRQVRNKDPKTLIEAMSEAQKIDIEDNQETRNSNNNYSTNNRFRNNKFNMRKTAPFFFRNQSNPTAAYNGNGVKQNNSEAVPMELGNIKNESSGTTKEEEENADDRVMNLFGLSREEVTRFRTEGLCFLCKKKGHIKRNCPMNNNKQYGNSHF